MRISQRPSTFVILLLLLLGADNAKARISSSAPIKQHKTVSVPEEEEQSQRYAQEESLCLSSFSIEVPGPCDAASLTAAVTSAFNSISCTHDIATELTLLFPEGVDQAAADACSSSNNALPFSSLSGQNSDLFDKEYFDGGTNYNADTPHTDSFSCPINTLSNDASIQRIKTLHDTTVTKTPIALPTGSNFQNCDLNTIMCCFTSDRDSSAEGQERIEQPNTDVCYHDLRSSPGSNHVQSGYVVYDGTKEEDGALCHAFAWSPSSTSEVFAGNLLYHISLYSHLAMEGHVRNIPGSPMCGCVEQMATVEKADCTQVTSGGEAVTVLFSYDDSLSDNELKAQVIDYAPLTFGPCAEGGNGIVDHYAASIGSTDKLMKHVVGEGQCDSATEHFLMLTQGIQRKVVATTVTRL